MSEPVTVVTKRSTIVTPAATQAVVFTRRTSIVTEKPSTQIVKTPAQSVLVLSRRGDPGPPGPAGADGQDGEDGVDGADGPIEIFVQDDEPVTTKASLWLQTNVGGDPTKFTVWVGESA